MYMEIIIGSGMTYAYCHNWMKLTVIIMGDGDDYDYSDGGSDSDNDDDVL